MYRFVVLLVAVGLGLGGGAAHADTVPYYQYTTHEGLPSTGILSLAQTSNGLLWIGTRRGLVVYDGDEFRTIALPDSVGGEAVLALQPMPDGGVWAGVGSDVVKATPRGVAQSHLLDSHNVVEILRRGKEAVFVTHQAKWERAATGDSLARTPFRYETLQDVTQVRGADLGPQGRVWIVNDRRGPGQVQRNGTVDFAAPPPPPPAEYAQNEQFFGLRFSGDGSALVTRGTRLYRFDPETGSFTVVANTGRPLNEIHRRGRTAYLTERAEVLRYDFQARRFREPIGPLQDLSSATTTAAVQDRDGGLWVGTQQAGLLHVPAPEARHVKSIDGHTIRYGMGLERFGDTVWGTTWGDGLFQLHPRRERTVPGGHTQWVALRSRDGRLHGLTAANPGGRKWYRWTPAGDWQFVAFAEGAVRGYVDSSGVGYFWHNQGLYRHVPEGDTTRRARLRSWPVEESQHHLMGPAPNGDIILFDQGDLLRLRRPDGAVVDTLATAPTYAEAGGRRLTIDAKGRVWCPFADLVRVDPRRGTAETLLEGVGVEKVVMAGDSLAMAKTDDGLYLLDANTGTVRRRLTTDDGLLANNINGALLTEDTLYVGHPAGLTLVPTDSLFRRPPRPNAVLTGLEVDLRQRPLRADSLFARDERAVGFSYTAASLSHAARVRFEERLVPRDSSWTATEQRFTRYTNLGPGTYRFEVRARLGDAPPGPSATHVFTIPPHFYETWWFQLLVGLALLSLGVGAYRWRIYRLQRRQRELEEAVTARTRELADEKEKTKRQAERLQKLDEAKNRFFAHVSHEFRTPLSLILSPLRDALQRAADGAAALSENRLRCMLSNAERLERLIDQLLDLATLEAGQMTLERQPGDLASVVERSAEAFRSKAEQKDIDLRVERPEGRIETRFDPEKVEAIVSNLVGNAVKFTSEGGTVTARIDETDPATPVEAPEQGESLQSIARITVEDTGPGIDPAVQETIFERFEQADNSATREHEGTGLGLALTSELVELHGGTIDVDSAPGEGATFAVQLPVVPVASGDGIGGRVDSGERVSESVEASPEGEPRSAAEPEPGSAAEAGAGAATVLVVEDNAEMRAHLREQFAGMWTVIEAADGEDGWQKVQAETPDLVLSDVMMPGLDGFELCQRIKANEALRTIPVLLLTARASETATREGLQCGADDYVAKPFDAAELRQRIANHLAARRHLQARYRDEVAIGPAVVDEEDLPFVEEFVEAIEARLSDPDLTVNRLADAVALSRRQLTRRLKDAVGQTPAAFLRERRLERAKDLLADDPETIAEVAYAVGFRSPSSFTKTFREQMGETPSEYVEEHGA